MKEQIQFDEGVRLTVSPNFVRCRFLNPGPSYFAGNVIARIPLLPVTGVSCAG